jgi:hypothetical protein
MGSGFQGKTSKEDCLANKELTRRRKKHAGMTNSAASSQFLMLEDNSKPQNENE